MKSQTLSFHYGKPREKVQIKNEMSKVKIIKIRAEVNERKNSQKIRKEIIKSKAVSFFSFSFCLFAVSWAAPTAYRGSQARGRIGAAAAGLRQSHSNTGSEPCL